MIYETDYLQHYGVKGMKWGVRRYRKKDGSLTRAGQRKYAKLIQKAAKDTTVKKRTELKKNIYEDLTGNYKSQMSKHAANILAKKKIWEDLDTPENSYFDSNAAIKDSAKAYKDALSWFEKNEKDYLNEIIKNNNGSRDNLDAYHDFRKVYEGYEDLAWSKGEKKFYKDRGIDPGMIDKAYSDYKNACQDATNEILGAYGKLSVSKMNTWDTESSVGRIVTDSLLFKNFDELKK